VREGFPADDEDYPPPRPRTQSPVLIDVTPSTLGVETVGGYCDAVIRRNARIPCEHTRVFATGRDLQTTVHVRVAQGESDKFDDNQYLGEVEVTNLRPATRGEILVSVTFELDANGSLVVRATDASTGQKARATMKLITVTQTDQEIDELTERSLSLSVKARVS
jgi:molecular chaperone DnaK